LTEVRNFIRVAQYLRNFIEKISSVDAPFHTMTTKGKISHWGKPQQWSFEELKRKINNVSVLAMPNVQQPFELETYASGYTLEVVLIQGGGPICYY
jgi:hypothetical protein